MRRIIQQPRLLLILMFPFLLSGCVGDLVPQATKMLNGLRGDNSDLEQYIQQVMARPGGGIAPIPSIEPHEPYIYPGHTRSPFDSTVIARPLESVPEGLPGIVDIDFDRPREPLEQYPLDSLRMVGTLEREGVRHALIRTPDRVIHMVRPGNHLGQNFGEIIDISDRDIFLREVVPDAFGGWEKRDNEIALSE